MDAILVPGGFGKRGVEGKIAAIRLARENGIPYLGICLGMQLAVIEYARHMAGLAQREQHRVRSGHAASGRRADHRMAEPRRLDREAQRRNRTWAARCGSARSPATIVPGTLAHRIYGATIGRRAAPASLRGQQPLPAAARVGGARRRRVGEERDRGRSVRDDRARRPPVVLRLPVPSRVHVEPAARASAVRELREGRARAGSAAQRARRRSAGTVAELRGFARRPSRVKLCGFDVGLDRPLFLIAGPCVVESAAAADRRRRRAEGDLRVARHPVHLQVVATTRRTAARTRAFADRAWTRDCASSRKCAGRSACRC